MDVDEAMRLLGRGLVRSPWRAEMDLAAALEKVDEGLASSPPGLAKEG